MTFDNKPTKEQQQRLGFLIYRCRTSAGITQEKLAEYLGYSPRWVQKIESGQGNPNWLTLIKLLMLFQLNPTQITEEVGIRVYLHSFQEEILVV